VRKALVLVNNKPAAIFCQEMKDQKYTLIYFKDYQGPDISLTLPVSSQSFEFKSFPPFFDGLLPEGPQLEGLLKRAKLDRDDYFRQLLAVGEDLVGAVNVIPFEGENV
jgi:serine/threonine-protein kinase HipA